MSATDEVVLINDPKKAICHPRKNYYHAVPNLIDDLDISSSAKLLYYHTKRVAGESGLCWQSTRTLAHNTRLGVGTVSRAKRELERAGLIQISEKLNHASGRKYHVLKIVDVWEDNELVYTGRADETPFGNMLIPRACTPPPDETYENGEVEVDEDESVTLLSFNKGARSTLERTRSTTETKEEPIEEEPNTRVFLKNDDIPFDKESEIEFAKTKEQTPEEYFEDLGVKQGLNTTKSPPGSAEEVRERVSRALERFYENNKDIPVPILNYVSGLPERIRGIAKTFCVQFGRPPAKKEEPYWAKTFRGLCDIGVSEQAIKEAFVINNKKGLMIKSPESIWASAWEAQKRINDNGGYKPSGISPSTIMSPDAMRLFGMK
jgi:hypothetical protein